MKKVLLLHLLLLGLVSFHGGMIDKRPPTKGISAPICNEKPGETLPQNDLPPEKKVDK